MLLRIIILGTLLFTMCCCLPGVRRRTAGLQVITMWTAITLLSEATAFYMAWKYRNNLAVFHIFGPLLLLVTGLYFTCISPIIKKYRIGIMLSIIGVVASVVNSIFLQPIDSFNSNFLLFGGLCICAWGFIVLIEFARDYESPASARNPHFWITVTLIFQQVGAYFLYILIRLLELSHTTPANMKIAYYALWLIGVLSYLSIGIVFLRFPAKKNIL